MAPRGRDTPISGRSTPATGGCRAGWSTGAAILLDRGKGIFRIEDRLEGKGRHRFEGSFHLAPGWSAAAGEEGWTARTPKAARRFASPGSGVPAGSRLRVEEDLHSPSYGVTRKAWTVRVEWEGEAPCTIRYALMPLERGRG